MLLGETSTVPTRNAGSISAQTRCWRVTAEQRAGGRWACRLCWSGLKHVASLRELLLVPRWLQNAWYTFPALRSKSANLPVRPPGTSTREIQHHVVWTVLPKTNTHPAPPCLSALGPKGMLHLLETYCSSPTPFCNYLKNVLPFVFSFKNFIGQKNLRTVGASNEKSRIGWVVPMSGDLE